MPSAIVLASSDVQDEVIGSAPFCGEQSLPAQGEPARLGWQCGLESFPNRVPILRNIQLYVPLRGPLVKKCAAPGEGRRGLH
jgi:hypothetical protein